MKHIDSYPLFGLVTLWLTGACADPLVDPQLIQGTRIIAARVNAVDDPNRAQLRAEESGQMQWLVVSDGNEGYAARAAWCLAEETSLGLPRCARAPFDEQTLSAASNDPAQFEFTLPRASAGSHWLGWLGLCAERAPRFDWRQQRFDCEDGSAALQGVYEGQFPAAGAELNNNPDLSDDEFEQDGEPWPALAHALSSPEPGSLEPGQACDDALPVVRPGEPLGLRWALGGDDREDVADDATYAAPTRESLTFTHLATAPGLERAYSALSWDSSRRGFELDFTLAEEFKAAREGTSISLILIVNDERGGTDWEHRALCARP